MLNNNITFAIINNENNWRSKYTEIIIRHYSKLLDGKIIYENNISDAFKNCTTKFLLIINPGIVILSNNFFKHLEKIAIDNRDIIYGDIQLGYDFVFLSDKLLFVNIELWKRYGSILYNTKQLTAPLLIPSEQYFSDNRPAYIFMDESKSTPVDDICFENGAALLITQMKNYFDAKSFSKEIRNEYYSLDNSTLYNELYFDTKFETEILPSIYERVDAFEQFENINFNNTTVDTCIIPAKGLYTKNFISKISAKNIIVYSNSKAQLQLQNHILNLARTTNYENILINYKNENPNAEIIGDPKNGRSIIIHTQPKYDIKFLFIDPIGYQLEKLTESINIHDSLVLDIGNYFIDPLLKYKKNNDCFSEYFKMFYSKLMSRPGPTYLNGVGPNYEEYKLIHINK